MRFFFIESTFEMHFKLKRKQQQQQISEKYRTTNSKTQKHKKLSKHSIHDQSVI